MNSDMKGKDAQEKELHQNSQGKPVRRRRKPGNNKNSEQQKKGNVAEVKDTKAESKKKRANQPAQGQKKRSKAVEASSEKEIVKDNTSKQGNSKGKRGRKPAGAKTNDTAVRTQEKKNKNTAETAQEIQVVRRVRQPERGKKQKKNNGVNINSDKKVKIIPLGGLEQIGMNITAFECDDSIIIVDCGLAFPEDDMLGIDLVIPDVNYLKENIDKVKGILITHGHEDHIGSLPYVLKEVNVPIYATKLTVGIIEHKLKEHDLLGITKRKIVKYGQTVNLGCFRVEFIRTNHSIADAAALAIFSPAGLIIHTGDFKVDYTPVFGDAIDLQRFGELGKKGVLALLCESTNVLRPGFSMSERTVGKTFDNIFAENKNNRIIIATFASNVDRVQQIIYTAQKYGRKVVIDGRSMVNIITIAQELGYIQIPDGLLIDIEVMKNYPDNQIVLVTTGSQGEAMAALSRMAASVHRKVTITPSDTVVFSSTPIPGNEKSVSKVINELSQKGAKVIFQDTHVSGHACQEEIKLIYALTKPKHAIPIHGEYRHRLHHAELAQELGIPKENTWLLASGDVLELSESSANHLKGVISAQGRFVDGLGVGDVGNVVLRDRQNLSENGLIVVALSLEKGTNAVISGPDIVSRGFVYVKESENLMEEAVDVVNSALDRCYNKNITDWVKMKNEIRDSLSDFIWKKMKRHPMILPIIMEV